MPVLDKMTFQIKHKHVKGVDPDSLVAQYQEPLQLSTNQSSLTKNMHIDVTNVELVIPLDEIRRFFLRLVLIEIEEIVAQL